MKINNIIQVLCLLQCASEAFAFTVKPSSKVQVPVISTALYSSPLSLSSSSSSEPSDSKSKSSSTTIDNTPIFPISLPMERVQGGGTVRTFQMPPWADRVQMMISTNGRPLKATVQLWLGPIRNTHTMEIDVQDGAITPFRSTLKFKKDGLGQVLKISTSSSGELPVDVGVTVPSEERAKQIEAYTEKMFAAGPKTKIQGGNVSGGEGAIRIFPVDSTTDAVQVICWARDTGKKSFKCRIELLQGPNNRKQIYNLQCGGGSQPYHAVFETPGSGWMVRIINKKFVEDGLFETVVVPYDLNKKMLGGAKEITEQLQQSPQHHQAINGMAPKEKSWWG